MLKKLFEYNHHTNLQLIQDIEDLQGQIPEKSSSIFSHILNAHHVWLCRIAGSSPRYGIWEQHVFNSFEAIENQNFNETLELLKTTDLQRTINYANSSGQTFQNTVEDICLHLINHSTYHRGQIALLHRQNDIQPLPTDYIAYRRNLQF